jgi:hypothetical protein
MKKTGGMVAGSLRVRMVFDHDSPADDFNHSPATCRVVIFNRFHMLIMQGSAPAPRDQGENPARCAKRSCLNGRS